jgi:hypothetical protein
MNFKTITDFENKIAEFYGSKYAVATDSCTHALELSLRLRDSLTIHVPKRTYISVPMLAKKLDIKLFWRDEEWVNYYEIYPDIIDAAVLWKKNSYIPNTLMCLSFQYQKHLSLGRGGMILTDNYKDAMLKDNYIFHVITFKYPTVDTLYADQMQMRSAYINPWASDRIEYEEWKSKQEE